MFTHTRQLRLISPPRVGEIKKQKKLDKFQGGGGFTFFPKTFTGAPRAGYYLESKFPALDISLKNFPR